MLTLAQGTAPPLTLSLTSHDLAGYTLRLFLVDPYTDTAIEIGTAQGGPAGDSDGDGKDDGDGNVVSIQLTTIGAAEGYYLLEMRAVTSGGASEVVNISNGTRTDYRLECQVVDFVSIGSPD